MDQGIASGEHRLPVMVVTAWANSGREARLKEREHICEQMSCGMTLLNAEVQLLGKQPALSYHHSQNFSQDGPGVD